MPDPASEQGEHILRLWQGAWIAALLTGVVVWGLIFWAVVAYRRRSDDEIPIQTRYNLPLEIFYTIAPIIMVIVFFSHTVESQNTVLDDELPVDNTIEVVGQQWSWTFNYGVGQRDDAADQDPDDAEVPVLLLRLRGRHRRPTSRRWCCRSARPPASTCTRPT